MLAPALGIGESIGTPASLSVDQAQLEWLVTRFVDSIPNRDHLLQRVYLDLSDDARFA
jgi:hypothetical protein